jgi:hypothetical protein
VCADLPQKCPQFTGKKRRDTGGILSIFAETMREIGGVCSSKALISVSLAVGAIYGQQKT